MFKSLENRFHALYHQVEGTKELTKYESTWGMSQEKYMKAHRPCPEENPQLHPPGASGAVHRRQPYSSTG